MSKKLEQIVADATSPQALARAESRVVAGAKLLSQKVFEYACARRSSGSVEIELKAMAEMVGLGPWSAQVKDRVLPMAQQAPQHAPLSGFVSDWTIEGGRVRLQWDVAGADEQVH